MNRFRVGRSGPCYPGFTLIEAMLVLAILGLLLGIGMPSLADFQARMRATSQAYLLHSAYQFARNEAIKTGKALTLCGSDDGLRCSRHWHSYLMVFEDFDRDRIVDDTEMIRLIDFDPGNNSFYMRIASGASYLELAHNGFVSQNGSLIYCDKHRMHHSRQLAFRRTGRPYHAQMEVIDGKLHTDRGDEIQCE